MTEMTDSGELIRVIIRPIVNAMYKAEFEKRLSEIAKEIDELERLSLDAMKRGDIGSVWQYDSNIFTLQKEEERLRKYLKAQGTP